jgi:hypothetical protein
MAQPVSQPAVYANELRSASYLAFWPWEFLLLWHLMLFFTTGQPARCITAKSKLRGHLLRRRKRRRRRRQYYPTTVFFVILQDFIVHQARRPPCEHELLLKTSYLMSCFCFTGRRN